MKIYQQQGAKLFDSNQGGEFSSRQDNISHQLGNGYPQFDVTLRKNGGTFFIMLKVTVVLMNTVGW